MRAWLLGLVGGGAVVAYAAHRALSARPGPSARPGAPSARPSVPVQSWGPSAGLIDSDPVFGLKMSLGDLQRGVNTLLQRLQNEGRQPERPEVVALFGGATNPRAMSASRVSTVSRALNAVVARYGVASATPQTYHADGFLLRVVQTPQGELRIEA